MDFLENTYYGNTLGEWFISLLLIVGSVLLGRAIYWFSKRWLTQLTQRSTFKADDILLDIIEEPLVASVILLGARSALLRLNFSEKTVHYHLTRSGKFIRSYLQELTLTLIVLLS